MMNDEIIGAAACIQGYAARLGLGMTLTRNQMVDAIPLKINRNLTEENILSIFRILLEFIIMILFYLEACVSLNEKLSLILSVLNCHEREI